MEKTAEYEDYVRPKSGIKSRYASVSENEDRLQNLKNFYEKRLELLKEDIKLVYQSIVSDDLLRTMREDPTSVEFVSQRVREIFDEVITNDREALLEKVYRQYTALKSDYRKLEEDKKKIEQEFTLAQQENFNRIQELERQIDEISYDRRNFGEKTKYNEIAFENDTFQGNFSENKRLFEESQSQLTVLKLKLKEAELKNSDLEDKNRKIAEKLTENSKNFSSLNEKNEVLQQENNELVHQLELYKDNTYSIEKEYDEKLFTIEKILKTNEEGMREALDKSKQKYKKKTKYYKSLCKELQKKQESMMKEDRNNLEQKIQTVNLEKEAKIREISDTYDKKLVEQAKLYEVNLLKLQKEYEKKMNLQLEDQESELGNQIATLEAEKSQIKQKFDDKVLEVERSYITKERFEEVLREKAKQIDDLKEELVKKELEFNKEYNAKVRANEERKAKEYETIMNTYRSNIKELEASNEEQKRKAKNLEKDLIEVKEVAKSLEGFKRIAEGKMAEKTIENDRNSKEKDELLKNLKSLERSFEEKTSYIKRLEKANSDISEEIRLLKERLARISKEKSELEQNKESVLNDFRELEKKVKENEREQDRILDFNRKNLDLEENYRQSLGIFKHNCEVLRGENSELLGKIKDHKNQIEGLQKEMADLQRKIAQIPGLLAEIEEFKTRETGLKTRVREGEEEINRKNLEINQISEELRKCEEREVEYERKVIRIKGNFSKAQGKITRFFNKLKEEKNSIQTKANQAISENYKEIMKTLSLFPHHLSRFLTYTHEYQLQEKARIEEKIAIRYEEITRSLRQKYEENERNLSGSLQTNRRDFEGKIKELEQEIMEKDEILLQEAEQKNSLEKIRNELEKELENLTDKLAKMEKSQEISLTAQSDSFKTFVSEVRDRVKSLIQNNKKLEKRKNAEIKKKALEIQKDLNTLTDSQTNALKKLKQEVLEYIQKNNQDFDFKAQTLKQENEILRAKAAENEDLTVELLNLKEEIRKNEENKGFFLEMYEASVREMEERMRKCDIELKNSKKEGEKLRMTVQDLEKSLLAKTEETKILKNEKSRLFERNEEIKNEILKEKEMNYSEALHFQKFMKKNHKSMDRNNKNPINEGTIDALENKVRELQKLNRNILENSKRMDTDRSLLKSPPIRNSSTDSKE